MPDGLVEALLRSLGSVLVILLFVMTLMLLFVMAMWMASPLVLFRGYAPTRALAESFNANFRNVRALTVYGLGMVGLALRRGVAAAAGIPDLVAARDDDAVCGVSSICSHAAVRADANGARAVARRLVEEQPS